MSIVGEDIVVISSDEEDCQEPTSKRIKMSEVVEVKTEMVEVKTEVVEEKTELVKEPKLVISGVAVQFPLQPYSCQTALMSKVIQGCKNREHCLLESPTGSGKTLALLCSSLAWQDWYYVKMQEELTAYINNGNTPAKMSQQNIPVSHGMSSNNQIGSCPSNYVTQSSSSVVENGKAASSTCLPSCFQNDYNNVDFEDECMETLDDKSVRKKPKIFYGTRTHRQIKQVVNEFKRTAYNNKKMTILSSREHTCIQESSTRSKTELCNELLDPLLHVGGCKYYTEDNKCGMSRFAVAEKLGLPRTWDIEDIVKTGKASNLCPYFAARDLLEEAEIVFCPYSYLIDPTIRESMHLNLTGHVIILDEAHNMEDICSDVGSITIKEHELENIIRECKNLVKHTGKYMYGAIQDFISLMLKWLKGVELLQSDSLRTKHASFHCHYLVKLFNNNEISEERRRDFEDAAKEALAELNRVKEQIKHGTVESSSNSRISLFLKVQLENLLQFFAFIVCPDRMDHYMAFITDEKFQKDYSTDSGNWKVAGQSETRIEKVLKLLCLNPGLIFKQVAARARCVILTSGTLSPTDSFASELKTNFKHNFQGRHVIPEENVYVNYVSRGPNNVDLLNVYNKVRNPEYQKALGMVLRDICTVVPHGVLCFFTSYNVMDMMEKAWKRQKIWDEITNVKDIFVEPHRQEKLTQVMFHFRKTIQETSCKPINGITGCLLLGVMRGKLAEGEDFKDEEARCVVTVGLPYMAKDMKIEVKMNYNNTHRSEGLLSGEGWYDVQTYRALNQALGRSIRHRNDWGAILLIDSRFINSGYREKLPKWTKNLISRNPYNWKTELQTFINRHKTITDN